MRSRVGGKPFQVVQGDVHRFVDRRVEGKVIVHDACDVAVDGLIARQVDLDEHPFGRGEDFPEGKLVLLLKLRPGRGFCNIEFIHRHDAK